MNNRSLILRRRGNVIILVLVLLTVMCGFCSLAVDYGRMQTAKTELQRAADAAARAGAAKLADGVSATETTIIAVAASNTVDGSAINLSSADIEFGTWNETNQTFTVLSGSAR
jgi:Flp pilus assembly protein TadG